VGTTGGKDVEAYFLETLISVYDRDRWIGDLDLLDTLRSDRLRADFLTTRGLGKICTCSTGPTTATTSHHQQLPAIVPAAGGGQRRRVITQQRSQRAPYGLCR